jgi:ABC-type sugar transport system permease subunit
METVVQRPEQNIAACLYCLVILLAFTLVLIMPAGRNIFLSLTEKHLFIMGFVKFALLATAGEIIALKISGGVFRFPHGMVFKMAVWGLIGMAIALMTPVFAAGVLQAQQSGILPGAGNALATAFLTSLLNNLGFGAAMMGFHTLSDTVIELAVAKEKVTLREIIAKTSWERYIGFVILRTLPIFWIPAHTVTYMLPPQYRVFFSAVLSIALGLILAISKRKK